MPAGTLLNSTHVVTFLPCTDRHAYKRPLVYKIQYSVNEPSSIDFLTRIGVPNRLVVVVPHNSHNALATSGMRNIPRHQLSL